mgnify:CR=1 FL=1
MITEADAKKFQALHEKEFGQKLSSEEALDCAESLVEMIKHIYKPIKKFDSKPCTFRENII